MSATFGGYNLFDPRFVYQSRRRFRREMVPQLNQANSFYLLSGRYPSRGWFLMRRGDYNNLNTYQTYSLVINDLTNGPITITNLAIIQARCVTRGVAADPNAIYLVEVTDQQGILYNRWFEYPTTSAYNIRSPAYPDQFYAPTINAGAPWTWNTMCKDLWNQMDGSAIGGVSSFLGNYPGLPITPLGVPENWFFPGTSCWIALNDILAHIGCTVASGLNSYSIVQLGAADAAATTLMNKYSSIAIDDWEFIDTGLGRVPKFVQVMFHRRNQYYGSEETVRQDSLQWETTPFYSILVTGPYPNAKGTALLWTDYQVVFDQDSNPLAASLATANTIAQDRTNEYYNRITRSTQGFLRRMYPGALPFVTGSLIDGVAWRQRFNEDIPMGWSTEIIRGVEQEWLEQSDAGNL